MNGKFSCLQIQKSKNGIKTEWSEDDKKTFQGNFVQKLDCLDVEFGEEPSEKEGLHAEWYTNGKKKTEKQFVQQLLLLLTKNLFKAEAIKFLKIIRSLLIQL